MLPRDPVPQRRMFGRKVVIWEEFRIRHRKIDEIAGKAQSYCKAGK